MTSGHYKGQQKNGNNARLRKVLFPDITVLAFHCLYYLKASDKPCKLLCLYWLSGQDAALTFVIFNNGIRPAEISRFSLRTHISSFSLKVLFEL
jgi:hypothetical protein